MTLAGHAATRKPAACVRCGGWLTWDWEDQQQKCVRCGERRLNNVTPENDARLADLRARIEAQAHATHSPTHDLEAAMMRRRIKRAAEAMGEATIVLPGPMLSWGDPPLLITVGLEQSKLSLCAAQDCPKQVSALHGTCIDHRICWPTASRWITWPPSSVHREQALSGRPRYPAQQVLYCKVKYTRHGETATAMEVKAPSSFVVQQDSMAVLRRNFHRQTGLRLWKAEEALVWQK